MNDSKSFFSWIFNNKKKIQKKEKIINKQSLIKEKQSNTKKNPNNETVKKYINKKKIDYNSDVNKENINKQFYTKNDFTKVKEKPIKESKKNFFSILKQSLKNTTQLINEKLKNIFLYKKDNTSLFNSIEEALIISDFGIKTTSNIMKFLKTQTNIYKINEKKKIYEILRNKLICILNKSKQPINDSKKNFMKVFLIVGVNGVGKTTTIGKLAYKYKLLGDSVMLVAGDTFRASAIDQIKMWGNNISIPVFSKKLGTDPSSVIFDAFYMAKSKKIDTLIIDTAGRLHNKIQLMEEMKKMDRVLKKCNPLHLHKTSLVIDACSGQNTLQQVKIFYDIININNIILTKMDSTAKGGIIFSISDNYSIPISYIGTGEKITDLYEFDAEKFVQILFETIT